MVYMRQFFWVAVFTLASWSTLPTSASLDDCRECSWSLPELIANTGYPVEEHTAIAEDGFELGVFRIPYGRNESPRPAGPPVILMHGLLDSAACWVVNLPHQSLGFLLADAGYDVWLPNNRGNAFSRPSCGVHKCWGFSFDEMASLDVPAFIGHVLDQTGYDKLSWVGHSQGTTQMFAHLSDKNSLADKLNIFVALAPAIFEGHEGSPLMKTLMSLQIDRIFDLIPGTEFMGKNAVYEKIAELICKDLHAAGMCEFFIFTLIGTDGTPQHNLNSTRLPLYTTYTPAGTSMQTMVHWLQEMRSKRFAKFDYGPLGNYRLYGQLTSPDYDLTRIRTPIAMFTGGHDDLATPRDELILLQHLDQEKVIFWKKIPEYNHLDFTWGLSAHDLVYKDVLKLLEDYGPKPSAFSMPLHSTVDFTTNDAQDH